MPRMLLGLVLLTGCATSAKVIEKPIGAPDPFVRVENGTFFLEGRHVRFFGVNVYSLASRPAPKFHCGRVYDDTEVVRTLEEIKALVPPPFVPTVRIMVFRNFVGSEQDWSRHDFIFAQARRLGVKVIATLDSHWGSCSGEGRRTTEWYRKGYRRPSAQGHLSQRDLVREAAIRYRHEPALLMWQVINEGQCDDPKALYDYAADLSGLIKSHDANHLVSFGTLGDDWDRSGAQGPSYVKLHHLSTIDVVESHDYPVEDQQGIAWRPEPLANCLATAKLTGKPCMIGELGMTALTPAEKAVRASILVERVRMFFQSGAQIVLIWSYRSGDWQKDFDPTDPMYEALRKASFD